MTTQTEALTLALEALKKSDGFLYNWHENYSDDEADAYAAVRQLNEQAIIATEKALAQPEQEPKCVAVVEVFGKDWRLDFMSLPVGKHKLYAQQYTHIASTKQELVGWKLVPIEPTNEMLKAMDECSTEGYDERLYAGHAASVYMAAVDVAPTPPQRKPLTSAEIRKWWASENGFEDCQMAKLDDFEQVVRAIEGKHGIKE